jgi:hypothetical protein
MRAINQWREFLMESDLSSPAKLVGFCLAQYYRPNKPTYPSQTTLMQDSSYSKNTVKDAIRELVAKCLITVEEKRIGGNSFKSFSYKFIGSAGEPVNEPVIAPMNEPSNEPSFNPSIDGAGGEHKVLERVRSIKKQRKEEVKKPDGVSGETWQTWIQFRKEKKAPISKIVVDAFVKDCLDNNCDVESTLKFWITYKSSWQGFRFDWLKPDDLQKIRLETAELRPEKQMKVVFSDDPDNIGYRNEK